MRLPIIQIPTIPEEEKTPLILQLLEIIEQISVSNLLRAEEIQLPWIPMELRKPNTSGETTASLTKAHANICYVAS